LSAGAGGSRDTAPSCAVVGSSDILQLHALVMACALAAQVDAHDVVLRVNHAPTVGHERVAGRKTTRWLVNHLLLGCVFRDRGARALRLLDAYARTVVGARTVAAGAELSQLEDECALRS
jgi:hypothetical protein